MQRSFAKRGIPEEAMPVFLASIAPRTWSQYSTVFKDWMRFSALSQCDPLEGSISQVLSFLNKKFLEGLSGGSLNNLRSALAFALGPHIGTDERISRFFKGVYKLRPGTPKYDSVWDPNLVLTFLGSLIPIESLPLEALTKKLVTLLALASGHRAQTLSLININNISFSRDSSVSIHIPDPIKTSGHLRSQPLLFLPLFQENPSICPVLTLIHYLERTAPHRGQMVKLFLSVKKPFREVASSTISRWIKATLEDSGVDTSIFSAHSTRHASTSKAARQGVNIDTIRRTAGWSQGSATFGRFYNRPVMEQGPEAFAKAVLS